MTMTKAARFPAAAALLLIAAAPAAAQHGAQHMAQHGAQQMAREMATNGPAASFGRHRGFGFAGPGLRFGDPRVRSRHDRGCGRFGRRGCFGGNFFGWGGFGYGGLVDDPEALRDEGFFADGDAWTEEGRAVYDYDRAYPYDWYRDPGTAPRPGLRPAGPAMRCDVSWVSGRGGAATPVRICRGRR
jgi:hypothetical protein